MGVPGSPLAWRAARRSHALAARICGSVEARVGRAALASACEAAARSASVCAVHVNLASPAGVGQRRLRRRTRAWSPPRRPAPTTRAPRRLGSRFRACCWPWRSPDRSGRHQVLRRLIPSPPRPDAVEVILRLGHRRLGLRHLRLRLRNCACAWATCASFCFNCACVCSTCGGCWTWSAACFPAAPSARGLLRAGAGLRDGVAAAPCRRAIRPDRAPPPGRRLHRWPSSTARLTMRPVILLPTTTSLPSTCR